MKIVLDKSFLFGASKKTIHEMSNAHCIIMPAVLFYELITTCEEEMFKCFKKIPQIDNPFTLVPQLNHLLWFEVQNNEPCTPLERQFINENYNFNEKLFKGTFKFNNGQIKNKTDWETSYNRSAESAIDSYLVIDSWFPELSKYNPGDDPTVITNAMVKVSTQQEFIKKIYGELRDEIFKEQNFFFPAPSIINPNWVIYRWLQVSLLYALGYRKKYGRDKYEINKKIGNDYIDREYCIIAALADGLATRDKAMKQYYSLLCPNNLLIF